ncbi:MAG: hypothetical protein K8M05_20575 [Deltaproteobacteria bacterium]|nr:hypothetical protein [Kofleriaceae bacterium]
MNDVQPDAAMMLEVRAGLQPVARDRDGLRSHFNELHDLIVSTEGRLSEIRNRGVWKRIFSNNTRDLANAMGSVVRIQQLTIATVMVLVQLNGGQLGMLKVVRDEITALNERLGLAASTVRGNADNIRMMQGTLTSMVTVVESKVRAILYLRIAVAVALTLAVALGTAMVVL